MGLDTTHDCWSGSYSAFGDWRRELARAAGLPPLETMEGFGGETLWADLTPDILHVLIHHSDCEGEIDHKHCAPLAGRLESLMPFIPSDVRGWPRNGVRNSTRLFIAGLREADEAGEPVEFL